jgi:hypothetical protein
MKYTVYVFPIVRVKVPDVEADSQAEAITKVDELMDSGKIDLHKILDTNSNKQFVRPVEFTAEYAEDIDGYHVDEVGDTEFKNSTWYDKEGRPL